MKAVVDSGQTARRSYTGISARQSGYEWLLLVLIVAVGVAISVGSQGNFLALSNLTSLFVNTAITAVPAVGMTMVILMGGIDVSIGSIVGLTVTVAGLGFQANLPVALVLAAAIATGGVAGLLNAWLIASRGIPPIITTLGTMSIWRAVVYALLGGNWISAIPMTLTSWFVLARVGVVPWSFILTLVLIFVSSYVLRRRPVGRYIYAIGNNEEGAAVLGLPARRVKYLSYVSLGVLTAVAALMTLGQSPLVEATSGSGFELDVIAAVVIGGTSILGGRGTVIGSLLGAVLTQLIQDGVILFKIQPFWNGVAMGVIILVAVIVSLLQRRGDLDD